MQVPGMIIQGRGKYGALRLDKAPVNSDPAMAETAGMATAAAEWRGLATPLRLSKLGLVGPGTLLVYKHQKLAKFEQAYTCTVYTEKKANEGLQYHESLYVPSRHIHKSQASSKVLLG